MRTEAEVKKRLKYYERRYQQLADKYNGHCWFALRYTVEKEWADWFLRRKPAPKRGSGAGVRAYD